MAKLPINIGLSLFTGGFNEVAGPSKLRPDEAQAAVDVDYRSGAIKGLKGLGDSGYTDAVPSGAKLMVYDEAGAKWVMSSTSQYALFDGQNIYLTQDGSYPVVYKSTGNVRLGLAEQPNITAATTSVTGGFLSKWYRYAFTFLTDDGLETNPTFKEVFLGSGTTNKVTFTYDLPTDARFTKIRMYRSLPVSITGGVGYGQDKISLGDGTTEVQYGTLFMLGELPIDGDCFDTGMPSGSTPLSHGPGGFSGSEGTTDDHSPWPNLVMLSNGLHSTTQANGAAGIIVGVDENGNVVYGRFGQPHYCPVNNRFKPPGSVQAIVTHTAFTAIVTDRAIYAMTGTTDDNVAFALTNSNVGCLPGAGKAVIYTPYGVVFPSIRGIELFDGDRSNVLTAGKLNPDTLIGWTIRGAVFWDNQYLLFHDDGTLILDLRTLPDVVLTTSGLKASCVQVANAVDTAPPPDPQPPVASMTLSMAGSFNGSAYDSGGAVVYTDGVLTAKGADGNTVAYNGPATLSYTLLSGTSPQVYVNGSALPTTVTFVNGVATFGYRVNVSFGTVQIRVTATLNSDTTVTTTADCQVYQPV